MGVKGRRFVQVDEPTLLGNIESIIEAARRDGFVRDHTVNIEDIVGQNGIIIIKENLPSSQSGYLTKNEKGQWIIGVNSNHHRHRQRYTIAHEFAHYCLHRSDDAFFQDEIFFRDENQSSIEYSANLFASKLLMPDTDIKHVINLGAVTLKELADIFDVSVLAVKQRVENLGYKLENYEK